VNAPVLISTWSFGQRGNRAAWPGLQRNGSAVDAVVEACTAVEGDPSVDSVGFGGLPDGSGEVSLDAAVMLAPNVCGGVCFVRRYLEVAAIARRVMEHSPHTLLAGEGAERFAEAEGFSPRELLSDDARAKWNAWCEKGGGEVDQSRDSGLAAPRPIDADGSGRLFLHPDPRTDEARWKDGHDTIGVLALDAAGTLAGACSTSGTPYKHAGRVGDSPIIGHGLYVEPGVGAATATGTGELISGVCGSFLVVEEIRRGADPHAAIVTALRRIDRSFDLRPSDQAAFIALLPDGGYASGALRGGFKVAVRTANRDEIIDPDVVLRDD